MNKYEILDRIGEGEYGVVLKGRNKESGELVAIKKFKEDDSDEENKRVILREVKILKTLHHENIIELKEAFRKKGKIYLVCEYVEKNLLEILEEGPVTATSLRQFMFQLLKGIAYMHGLNVIHRDIKPENVLISRNGNVKICDLGFARTIPSNRIMTDYVATRWYRAPELLIGRDDYDKSIDIWSAGCVMAEIFDGEPLFPGENDLDQLYLIQKCLGPLTAPHQEHFLKNPKFIGMKFPEIQSLESIERRYFGKVDKQGLDLLKKMLKMDPKARITADEALAHSYFHRAGSLSEVETRRHRDAAEEKKTTEQHELFHANHSNSLVGAPKVILPINNFIEDRGEKVREELPERKEKGGVNKVTGLIRLKKAQLENVSNLRPSNLQREQEGSTNKGKSVGSKKVTMKDKYGALTDKRNRAGMKSRVEAAKQNNYAEEMDEYYEEKWQQQEQEQLILDRKKDKSREKSGAYIRETRQPKEESPKKEQVKRSKMLGKSQRKDNFNIIFNNNTYNLNLLDAHNG